MIDWEDILRAENPDELQSAKIWLFKENIRLKNREKDLDEAKEKFLNERLRYKDEMDQLNLRIVTERKRLKEENLFFDKKMEILKAGFVQLESDRKRFEAEKKQYDRELAERFSSSGSIKVDDNLIALLFRNTNNPLTLRKRYKDLVKIFHPDNLLGDEELMQAINDEFQRRREEM
ncbi:MAG: hypothetical protein J6033_07330 [Lachnospiraceae bacterium]|nr:hypothetical protein [Lachnospiraceae bacterium]